MFEQQIINQIIQAWTLDQEHPHRDRKKKPIPQESDIKEILEQSFLASLKREEEKPIAFTLAFLNKENVENEIKSTSYKQLILTFDTPLPFNTESISKVGPAFDPKISSLIVGKSNDFDNSFCIWGAMFFGPSLNRFTEIPVGLDGHIFFRPDVFMITAKQPGSLVISRGNSQIGNFATGKFLKATPQPHGIEGLLSTRLIDNIKNTKGFKTFSYGYWHIYRDSLDYLLTEAADRGHGATILIVPDELTSITEKSIVKKYSFPESPNIEELIYQISNNSKNFTTYIAYKTKLKERLEFMSQLSTVDGSLVLKPSFNPISFGSTLKAPSKWEGSVVTGPDGFGGGGENFETSRLGTRHNSTIDFVGAFPGCIGFVISQDGPIRAFLSSSTNVVTCWPDCRASMFI